MGDFLRRAPGLAAWALALCSTAVGCGATERRPNVPPSAKVLDLRRAGGDAIQDCGGAPESRTDTLCRVQPVGECVEAALKACRPAFGTRSFFTAEGDPVRDDWLVLSDGQGGCKLTFVEDRSRDPLAPRKPSVQICDSVTWKSHDTIANCEVPVADGCHATKPDPL